MSSPAPSEALLEELGKLESRPLPRDGKQARGRPSVLFRLIEEVPDEAWSDAPWTDALRRLAAAFAPRLGDRALAPDILRATKRPPLRAALIAALEARRDDKERFGVERAIDGPISGGIAAGLDLLALGFSEDLDERALPQPPETLSPDEAIAILEERSQTAKALRDPAATALARLALAVLGRALDQQRALAWVCDTIAWESLRAGKEIPTLALAGLAALDAAPPLPRLRAAEELLSRIDRRVVVTRLRAITESARAELDADEAVIDDLIAAPLDAPVSFSRQGAITVKLEPPSADDEDDEDEDAAEIERLKREAAGVREQWSTRLETAMILGETWPAWAWRAVFPESGDPVRGDLATRVLWSVHDADEPLILRWQNGFFDVFNEPYEGPIKAIGLAHPIAMDPDELKLWQEWWPEEGPRQPFPQVFRLAFPEDEAAAALEMMIGQVFPSNPPTPRRSRGLIGLPLRGRGPWELERRFGEDSVFIAITEGEQRIEMIDGTEELQPRLRSELALELLDLLGASVFESEAFWRDWNKRLIRKPDEAWQEAVAVYRRGPKRLAALRKRLTVALAPALPGGEGIDIQGRFARIEGEDGAIVELGSGRIHGLDRREHKPWRASYHRPLPLPHDPAADPQTDRVLGAIAYFAERVSRVDEE